MKILYFIDSLGSGGKERRLLELIKRLSKMPDYEMELVVTKNEIHYKEIFSMNIKIHFLVRKGFKKDPRIFINFFKITKSFKPDIIHVWSNMVAIYAIPTKFFLKIPMINNQITNAPEKVSNSFFGPGLTFPFSDKIIANTYAGLKAYKAPKNKSLVIYNGFDFNRIKNLEEKFVIRKKFKIETKYVVGMVASNTVKKDYLTYIKGALLVLNSFQNVTFLCIGSGDFSEYRNLIPTKYVNKILFLGKQDAIESIMNVCDIGVLITNNDKHGEGISNAILEFFALGIPVIATRGGGNAEIIEDKISGFLISPKSENELAFKILELIKNENIKREFGFAANHIVIKKFSISEMIDQFNSIYTKELDGL